MQFYKQIKPIFVRGLYGQGGTRREYKIRQIV